MPAYQQGFCYVPVTKQGFLYVPATKQGFLCVPATKQGFLCVCLSTIKALFDFDGFVEPIFCLHTNRAFVDVMLLAFSQGFCRPNNKSRNINSTITNDFEYDTMTVKSSWRKASLID